MSTSNTPEKENFFQLDFLPIQGRISLATKESDPVWRPIIFIS